MAPTVPHAVPPATPERKPTLIGSVRRALLLLEIVAKRVSRTAGLPLDTTYHLLRTLVHDGYPHHERGAPRWSRTPAAPTSPDGPSAG
ncbi:hypothetical protein [Streptomyces sp. NPDC001927]